MFLGEADEETMGVMAFLAIVPLILCSVFNCILHYKCWKAVPTSFARLTPGKAVGFLFIPFYGLYWAFPSFKGLGSDCSVIAETYGMRGFSSLSGLGLTYAILWIAGFCLGNIPVLGFFVLAGEFVIWILFYSSVIRLLNELSAKDSEPNK